MINKINQKEINGAKVSSLAIRPSDRSSYGAGGKSPTEVRAKFDQLALLIIERYNELIDAIGSSGEGSLAASIPTDIDGKTLADVLQSISSGGFGGLVRVYDKDGKLQSLQTIIDALFAGGGIEYEPEINDIVSIDQVVYSTEDGGENVWRVTLADGTHADFHVRNGSQGSKGEQGNPFEIYTTFPNEQQMLEDAPYDGVPYLAYVMVKNEPGGQGNGRLYRKQIDYYEFIADLAGPTGSPFRIYAKFENEQDMLDNAAIDGVPHLAYVMVQNEPGGQGNGRLYQKVDAWYELVAELAGPPGERGKTGGIGPQGIQGIPGEKGGKGDKGDPFSVSKIYGSVAAMNAGYASDGVALGGFVVIETGNVEDEDNAKVFCKGESGYVYITDMSGARGLQGPRGYKGEMGDPFRIVGSYHDVNTMHSMHLDDGYPIGSYVIIECDPRDPDNGKLFRKGENGYVFVVDMSGPDGRDFYIDYVVSNYEDLVGNFSIDEQPLGTYALINEYGGDHAGELYIKRDWGYEFLVSLKGPRGRSLRAMVENLDGEHIITIYDEDYYDVYTINLKDGKTPVVGVDFFTPADKAEMVNSVLAALPKWEGGSY